MTEILVDLDALQDVVMDLRHGLRDMDTYVRRAYNEVHSMHDSGRGLNEVRQRADDLLRAHRAIDAAGTQVERYLATCADVFARTDYELATQIRSLAYERSTYTQAFMLATMAYQQSAKNWFATLAVNADWVNTQIQRIDTWSLAQRYAWIATYAKQLTQETMQQQTAIIMPTIDAVIQQIGVPAVLGSKILALNAVLTQFLPTLPQPITQEMSAVSALVPKLAQIVYGVPPITKDLDEFAYERTTVSLIASSDAMHTGLVVGSSGLRDIGMLGTDAVQQALAMLPTDLTQCSNAATKWVTTASPPLP